MRTADNCCARCRAVPGACGLKRNCRCHRKADAREYSQPDPYAAVSDPRTITARIHREERKS